MAHIKIFSSLEKIFTAEKLPEEYGRLTLLKNERGSIQAAVTSDLEEQLLLTVSCDIPYTMYMVKEIYAGLAISPDATNCTVLNGGKSGYYPDLLTPFNGKITTEPGKNTVIWIEFSGNIPGEHRAIFTLTGKEITKAEAVISVSDTVLPEQKLRHINWFHSDCLATHYNVEVFGEEYWRITENFMKNAAKHGVNVLLTPVFTPALDTEIGGERPTVQLTDIKKCGNDYIFGFEKLDRWIETAFRSGIKYFEISHFFTQWGAEHAPKIMATTENGYERIFGWETDSVSDEYMDFLRQFGIAFKKYTDKKGITDICYVHCSDEPSIEHLERYAKTSEAVRKYFSAYEHIDALSDFDFYTRGLIGTPIPGEQEIESFKGKVANLWTYYCCGQYRNELPNRFLCMPSIRNRILGVLLYKYGCEGFLQWGFNFYYTRYSKRSVDPFTETDAGGEFPAGDSFIVYPSEDGTPLPSLRQKVFYDAIQDISALRALEEKTSREHVLSLIKESLGDITFTSYPFETKTFMKFRENLFAETALQKRA